MKRTKCYSCGKKRQCKETETGVFVCGECSIEQRHYDDEALQAQIDRGVITAEELFYA